MKTQVNYMILKDSMVLNFESKTITIAKKDKRYQLILAAIKENRMEDIPKLASVENVLNSAGMEVVDGQVVVDGEKLPDALNSRILQYMEEKVPFKSLLLFWQKLKKNPSFNSRKMLFAFLEHNGHPLTEDGCFIAYRGVTDDFKDKHTGQFDNSPGSICEMPRDQVDDNPDNTCSSGLHVAAFSYARNFGSKVVEVKVHPEDVVCVPRDYDGTKMRVCKFEVLSETHQMRNEALYGQELQNEAQKKETEEHEELDMQWYDDYYDSYANKDEDTSW